MRTAQSLEVNLLGSGEGRVSPFPLKLFINLREHSRAALYVHDLRLCLVNDITGFESDGRWSPFIIM